MKKSKLCLFSLVVLLGLVGCNNTSNTSSSVTSSAASSVSDTSSNTPSSTPVSSNTPSSTPISSSTPVTSSSSSSEAIRHTITKKIAPQLFARDQEGTSTIKFDKESYLAGETVTYTIETDEYAFGYDEDVFNQQAIIVVGGEAIPFNVKQNEDVEWVYVGSFTMPDVKEKDVTFYAAPYSIIYYGDETSPALKTITYDVCDGIVAIGPSSFSAGSNLYSITLHRTKSIAITKASLTIGSTTTELNISSLNWQNDFVTLSLGSTLANDNVSIKIEGKEVQTYKLNIVGTDYVSFYNGNPAGDIMEGVSIDFSFGFKSGYNVTYTITGATNTAYSPTNRIQFVMPSNDVTITFTGSSYASISVQNVEHVISSKIYVDEGSSNKVEATSCQAGSSFYVTAELETGYKLGEAYLLGHEDDKVSPNSVNWGYDSSTYSSIYKDCYTFTMPSDGSPATVVISVVKSGTITLTSDDDHYTSCVVKDSPYSYGSSEKSLSDFAPGDDFYLFPAVKDGFRLTGATISDGTTSSNVTAEYSSNSYYVKGTMPDNGVANVTFTFGQVYGISIENESDISSKVRFSFSDYSKQFAEGSNVKISISEVFGYTLNGLSYKDNNGTTVALEIKTDSYSRKYVEFTMPGYAITLTPSISEATKVNVTLGYKNNSSWELGMVKVGSTKGSASVSEYYVESGADVSEAKDLYDGDTINCQVSDYDAWSDELEDFAQRFNVIVEVTYTDGKVLTKTTTFEYGAYTADVALESNIKSVIVVITDAAN